MPRSATSKVAETYLRVGMFLTAGSLALLTSIVGVVVTPSSLKTEYPVIGQPPLSVG